MAAEEVGHDVRLAHVEKEVVPEDQRARKLHKGAIANAEILYAVSQRVDVERDLELTASVLLLFILVLCRDHKVIHYLFLQTSSNWVLTWMYSTSSLLVPVAPICWPGPPAVLLLANLRWLLETFSRRLIDFLHPKKVKPSPRPGVSLWLNPFSRPRAFKVRTSPFSR